MKKALSCALVAMMTASMLLTGCGSKPAAPADKPAAETEAKGDDTNTEGVAGGTLVVRGFGDPMSFNPNLYPDDNYYSAAQNMFYRLTKMDASKSVIPDLATSWDWSDDSLTLTFHLMEGVKWSDGEDLTAEDVAYTFNTMKDVETSCYISSTLQACVDSVEATDDYTVVFHLSVPEVSIVSTLGWYGTFILPEHIYNNGQSWAENEATTAAPVTSGNFKLGEYKTGESLSIVKSEYAVVEPKLDAVVYSIIPDETTAVQALTSGEIDFFEAVPTAANDQFLADPSIRMDINEYPSPMRLIFNYENETLQDIAVRQAIALCVNRDEISSKIFQNVMPPEYAMYPSLISWVSNTDDVMPEYNIEEAKQVLEAAGYTADADGYYVRGLTITCFQGNGYPDATKLICAAAKEAGIEIEIEELEYNAWADKVYTNREFCIEIQGGFMGPDPSAMAARFGTGANDNIGVYSNAKVDELLAVGGTTGDQAARAEAYKEAQKLMAEEFAYIPIVGYASYDAAGANLINLPIDGTGKWGWAEWTYTEFTE